MLFEGLPGDPASGQQGAQRHRGSSLYIVVKAAEALAIPVEYGHRIGLGKVFKLNQNAGPAALCSAHEQLDKLVVLIFTHPGVPCAHVHRVIQERLVVGSDVEHYGQGMSRADAATGGVQRELANGYAHPTDTLISEAKYALTVGDHNHFNVVFGGIAQYGSSDSEESSEDDKPKLPTAKLE